MSKTIEANRSSNIETKSSSEIDTALVGNHLRSTPTGKHTGELANSTTQIIPTNEYGNVDIRDGVPKGLAHIPRAIYHPLKINALCRKANCPAAPALCGFTRNRGVFHPDTDGIVVPIRGRRKIMAIIEEGHRRLTARKLAKPRDYTAGFVREYGSPQNALRPAAHAMFDLNRYAKHPECHLQTRSRIYSLKGWYIKLLHHMGLCESVQEHRQLRDKQECYRCEGFGCDRCGWSGLYKSEETVVYYVFTFNIEGTRFCWHQPAEEVDFEVSISGPASPMPEIGIKTLAQWTSRIAKAQALVQWVVDGLRPTQESDHVAPFESGCSIWSAGEHEGLSPEEVSRNNEISIGAT